jgi:hypothetical protein
MGINYEQTDKSTKLGPAYHQLPCDEWMEKVGFFDWLKELFGSITFSQSEQGSL